jgi:hypothetical protein
MVEFYFTSVIFQVRKAVNVITLLSDKMGGWMDEWMDRQTDLMYKYFIFSGNCPRK